MRSYRSVLLVFSLLFAGLTAGAQTATEAAPAVVDSQEKLKVRVKGVGCSMDLKTLSDKVAALDGVTACKTLKRGAVTTFEVAHDPARVDAEAIHAAIENTAGCTSPESRPYKVKL